MQDINEKRDAFFSTILWYVSYHYLLSTKTNKKPISKDQYYLTPQILKLIYEMQAYFNLFYSTKEKNLLVQYKNLRNKFRQALGNLKMDEVDEMYTSSSNIS